VADTFQVISPVDGSVYADLRYSAEDEIETSLEAARAVRSAWKRTSIAERAAVCRKAVDYFQRNVQQIAVEITWQMGRPIRDSGTEITRGFSERAEYMIGIAGSALADIPVSEGSERRFIRKSPLGTVFVVSPWNYPYLTSVNAVIPALMSGNAVILKHAAQTPLCARRYAEAFEWAGLPEGVFHYLQLDHAQVGRIVRDPRIDYVAFTGSVAGGKAVQSATGDRFISAGLELGGKDPAYVCRDADLEAAVEGLVDGSFYNAGQSCCAVERIYVDERVYDDFVSGFVELTRRYVLGDPTKPETTLGPMVRESAAAAARAQIDEAVSGGATTQIAANEFPDLGTPYLAPQVLLEVDHTMRIMTEESFAPIVGIMKVRNDDEAIRLMNDSEYGLSASIWTRDTEHAVRIGDEIETGTWFMNRCDYLDPALAWTGVKNSGNGCSLSVLGYDQVTRPKSFNLRS